MDSPAQTTNKVAVNNTVRQSQVTEEIESLVYWLENLSQFINDLESRLATTLRPEEDIDRSDSSKANDGELVPLAQGLNSIKNRVREATYRIQSMHERIEL